MMTSSLRAAGKPGKTIFGTGESTSSSKPSGVWKAIHGLIGADIGTMPFIVAPFDGISISRRMPME